MQGILKISMKICKKLHKSHDLYKVGNLVRINDFMTGLAGLTGLPPTVFVACRRLL